MRRGASRARAVRLVGAAAMWAFFSSGCGGGTKATGGGAQDPRRSHSAGDYDEDDDGVSVESSRGVLDPEQIRAIVEPHSNELSACYISRVGDRRWLGGKVQLKWQLSGAGHVESVHINESDLGAWPVEKCLLTLSRSLKFPAPRGGSATDFTVPLEFSATGKAVEWDEAKSAAALAPHLGKLAACGVAPAQGGPPAQPSEVALTLYVGAQGQVLSAGFAVDEVDGFSDAWADCAHGAIAAWRVADTKAPVAKLFVRYKPPPAAP